MIRYALRRSIGIWTNGWLSGESKKTVKAIESASHEFFRLMFERLEKVIEKGNREMVFGEQRFR